MPNTGEALRSYSPPSFPCTSLVFHQESPHFEGEMASHRPKPMISVGVLELLELKAAYPNKRNGYFMEWESRTGAQLEPDTGKLPNVIFSSLFPVIHFEFNV